ncbi:MAG: LysE family translocator [Chitinophagaceae bacterium]
MSASSFWQSFISGLTLGAVLALSVGPVIFTIIKQSLNHGPAGGFSFVTGVWVSDILLVILSNIFSELVRLLLAYQQLIGIVGSLFLLLLGIFYIFFKKVSLQLQAGELAARVRKQEMIRIFTSGFLINTLNPNVIIFWLGVATAFSGSFDLSDRLIIFTTCLALNMLADTGKVVLAGRLRKYLTLQSIGVINKVSGSLLILFGLALFYGVIFLSSSS